MITTHMMMLTGILLIVVCLSVVAQGHSFLEIAAIVNGPVTLPCNCSGQEVKWNLIHTISESIAVCHQGNCQIEQDLRKRFSIVGNTSAGDFSIRINSTLYNDAGFYTCTCKEESASNVKLKVYVPLVVKGFEGENVTLPCYGDTRKDAKDVQWKKDGKVLLEYADTDKVSEGRFTGSKEGFLVGYLPLHINSVQQSDAGLYLCRIHRESREGDPRAVLLNVTKRQSEHQPPISKLALKVIPGLVLLGVIIYVIFRMRRHRVPQDVTSTNPGPPVQNVTSTDEGCPVQEQHPMLIKASTTHPIQD